MIVITDISSTSFSVDGVLYNKNFMSTVNYDRIKLINAYDSKFTLIDWTKYEDISVNGNTYANVAFLQEALLEVIYTRDTLNPSADAYWGSILGDINNQTDLINLINNNQTSGSYDKQEVILYSGAINQIQFGNSPYPKMIEVYEDGEYRIENGFYTYDATTGLISFIDENGDLFTPEAGTQINITKYY